jgi:putative ABC transport system permease protein
MAMLLEGVRQDVLYAVGVFHRHRVSSLIAVASLGLGIGVGTAIFSIVNAVLLRPLPYRDPGRLVMLWSVNEKQGGTVEQARNEGRAMSGAEFLDWQERSGIFERMVAFGSFQTSVTGPGDAGMSFGYSPSPGLFPLLGVKPMLGRGFVPEDERPGSPNVAVIFYGLWKSRFGGNPGVLGQKILFGNDPYTIVGVMPPRFVFFNRQVEFLTPQQWAIDRVQRDRGYRSMRVMARLKPGISLQQAQARADVFSENLARAHPETNSGWKVRIFTLAQDSSGGIRPALLMLMGAVGCVLLITCVNAANLILVQVASRSREFAVRSAMGASRARLVRQLLTESLILSAFGGLLGLGFAWTLIARFQALLPDPNTYGKYLVQVEAIRMDPWVASFALLVALLTGIVFGLVPALRASRPNLNENLTDAAKGSLGGRHSRRVHDILIVAEVSLALVMVTGAVLLVRSFMGLFNRGPGIRASNVITMQSQAPYWEILDRLRKQGVSGNALSTAWQAEMRSLTGRILDRLRTVPGVRSADITSYIPMTGWYSRMDFTVEGHAADAGATNAPQAIWRTVSPGYFETIGIPLLRGRLFDTRDTASSAGVVVVSQELARRYWPREDPLGKRMKAGDAGSNGSWLSVVGMVGDVREDGIAKPPPPTFYVPINQATPATFFLAIRANADPLSVMPAVRRALKEVDPELPIYRLRKLEDVVLDSTWQLRYSMLLLGGLAGLSLVLAVVGVYGVLSHAVEDRTQEIGVRMALGAAQGDVVRLLVLRGLRLVAFGVAIGLAAAFGLTRSLSVLLFGVSPLDPLTFASVAAVLIASGWLACYLPALRASRVNPMTALRYG